MKFWILLFLVVQVAALLAWFQMRWPWVRYAGQSVFQIQALLAGVIILILPCVLRAWKISNKASIKDQLRVIDEWSWKPLNWVYGQPEDGVSGKQAIVYTTGQAGPYLPAAGERWRAYCWNHRNWAGNLKYVFSWPEGPIVEWTWILRGKTRNAKIGWQQENGFNVPVFSP